MVGFVRLGHKWVAWKWLASNKSSLTSIWQVRLFSVFVGLEKSFTVLNYFLPIWTCSLYTVRQEKKVSCEEKRPVDADSWEPIKRPYFGGFSRSIRRGGFSTPKVRDSCYFCRYLYQGFSTSSVKTWLLRSNLIYFPKSWFWLTLLALNSCRLP